MKQASELRAEAREALKGMWGSSAVMVFVYEVLVSAASVAIGNVTHGSGSVLAAMALAPMAYALNIAFLRLLRKDPQELGYLFQEFNSRVYSTMILTWAYTILWTLLLIIPGIIKGYSYAMTPYILEDRPELSGDKAIEESMRMMSGHKWELFWLHLTFIGWGLLCILTLCIGFFWLVPYMNTAQAAFYENLITQQQLESEQPTHSEPSIQEFQYFCIKDKGYHVSVWPKDVGIGEYIEFNIAGLSFRDKIMDYTGEFVATLVPEPTNEYDSNAIKIVAPDDYCIGYVPKDLTSEIKKHLPCKCYCYIGYNNDNIFSCAYIKLYD